MSIKSIMTQPVVCVEMDDSLNVIKEIFDNTRFHHLLVVESDELVGIISDRDLLKALSPDIGTVRETAKDAAILNKKAHQIMTRKPFFLRHDATIFEAIEVFNAHNISCIPVVNDTGKPTGIVSWRDILREIAARRNK